MALIIPKCNAEPETLKLTLKVYYDDMSWVSNSDLIDRLSRSLIAAGIETEKKEPQSYTKKTQVLSYYGLIEWEDAENVQSRRRISENGKKFYKKLCANDKIGMQRILIEILAHNTFGRNVLGCASDSDLEAPNIFLKSTLLLGRMTNKEFAYILGKMELEHQDFADVLFDVLLKRKMNLDIVPRDDAKKWGDPKPILALADWGLFSVSNEKNVKTYYIDRDIIDNFSDELRTLRIKNTESLRFTSSNEANTQNQIHRDLNKYILRRDTFLTTLRTKPFMLLAGISGTGKSRIVREFAFKSCPEELQDADGTTPGNYCMVEVKPNWHDSTELLGYWSNINNKYMFTKFVKFLVKAMMYPNVPFFVCLDEMNLAPVEQYFAEFLSVLETRRIVETEDEDGEIYEEVKSGVLVDKEYFLGLSKLNGVYPNLRTNRDIYFKLFDISDKEEMEKVTTEGDSLLTEGLTLPENVFIVGTVNMDDTTHQFSRKVIDRAMTIEMNGGALADIFKNSSDLAYTDTPLKMEDLCSHYVSASEVLEKCYAVVNDAEISNYIQGKGEDGLPQRLEQINKVLNGTPFTVSYRVMNELTIYLAVLLDQATDEGKEVDFDTFKQYVDTAIDKILLMKILPRVEGDDEMFNISANECAANSLPSQVEENGMSRSYTKLDWLRSIAPQHTEENVGEYMAVDKLDEMTNRLFRQNFTRYWP